MVIFRLSFNMICAPFPPAVPLISREVRRGLPGTGETRGAAAPGGAPGSAAGGGAGGGGARCETQPCHLAGDTPSRAELN